MHAHDALKALRAAGIAADAAGPRHLRADGIEMVVHLPRSAPTRADAARALASVDPEQRVILIAEKLTPSLSLAALDDDRIVVVARDTVIWERQLISLIDQETEALKRPTGPRPYGRFAVARALLAPHAGPVTQQQLVDSTGISQGNVSKALASPLFDGVIDRSWGEIRVCDQGELFDRVVAEYPGPGGVTTYWWNESPLVQQAQAIAAVDETALVSGDIAADAISAWRQPEHAVVYTRAEPELRKLGFAMADPDDYTLMLVYPEDVTLWSTARSWSRPSTADPMIASFDVTRTGTVGDQGEAVDRIKSAVVRKRR